MSDGIGFGERPHRADYTRLAEMSRLGSALAPFGRSWALAAGDLVPTCIGQPIAQPPLRYYAGGRAKRVQEAQDSIGRGRGLSQYQRGVGAGAAARRGNADHEQIYQVLYCHKDAREVALSLLGRA